MPRKKGGPFRIDLSGQRFGKWTVSNERFGADWKCICDCGTVKIIHSSSLKLGTSKSCGCSGKDWCTTHGMENTLVYNTWAQMLSRCRNPKSKMYKDYGGRGIKVYEKWHKFEGFIEDMGEKPCGLTLDRIDVNGDYNPSNCRWASFKEQARNKRNTVYLDYDGQRKSLPEWAEIKGIKRRKLAQRLGAGWTVERALTTP